MRRRFINPAYALVSCLLLGAWVMLVIAIALPEWSRVSTVSRIGLWITCQRSSGGDWACSNVPSPASDDGFFIAARVFTISAAVAAACGMCFAWSAILRPCRRFAGLLLLGTCIAVFAVSMLAWGMWIGFHGRYVEEQPESAMASSFILTCSASAVALLCCPLAVLGLKLSKNPGKAHCRLSRHLAGPGADLGASLDGLPGGPGPLDQEDLECPKFPPVPAPSPESPPD